MTLRYNEDNRKFIVYEESNGKIHHVYNITTTNNGYSALGDDYITVEHAARAIHERLKELNAQPE